MKCGRAGAVLVAAAVSVTVASCAAPHAAPREITLVAQGMTFRRAAAPQDVNPVLILRAGERVRLVVRNETPGVLHGVEIPAVNVTIEELGRGQSRGIVFTVPNVPGRYEYRCPAHAAIMRGAVEIMP